MNKTKLVAIGHKNEYNEIEVQFPFVISFSQQDSRRRSHAEFWSDLLSFESKSIKIFLKYEVDQ
jgi:hypothetical protein